MNRRQTVKIIMTIKSSYPNWASKVSGDELRQMVDTWTDLLRDYDYKLIASSIKALVATSKWPPSIAEIIQQCQYIASGGKQEMTEQEAWGIVMNAVRNSNYHADVEFDKLPSVIKSVVGGPHQLKSWAMTDEHSLETVIASNFMRSFKARKQAVKQQEALPNSVKDTISQIANGVKMIE